MVIEVIVVSRREEGKMSEMLFCAIEGEQEKRIEIETKRYFK
jgi:hypothetical protein